MDMPLRLTIAASLSFSPLLPLSFRLMHLQIMEHQSLEKRVSWEVVRISEELIPRADILDRNNHLLAHSMPVWTCFLDKAAIKNRAHSLSLQLAPLLGMPT